MSLNKFIIVLIATLCTATSVFAAGKSREFSMDGNYIAIVNNPDAALLNVSLGQFLAPQIVIVTSLRSHKNFGYTGTTIGVGGKYYFMDGFRGDLVPFAGLGLGLRQLTVPNAPSSASTEYEVNLGFAFFMADNTTLDAKIRLLNFSDTSRSLVMLGAGFSQRF